MSTLAKLDKIVVSFNMDLQSILAEDYVYPEKKEQDPETFGLGRGHLQKRLIVLDAVTSNLPSLLHRDIAIFDALPRRSLLASSSKILMKISRMVLASQISACARFNPCTIKNHRYFQLSME